MFRSSQFSRLSLGIAAIGALAITGFVAAPSLAAEDAVVIPAPAMDAPASDGVQTVVLSGGCFWGVQGVFQHTAGVVNALSGYAGGNKSTAQYDTVSTGTTGHAESVQVKYDPKKISYGKLLQIFFSVAHNPTELNRQGPDSGTQYRSAIFTTSDAQKKVAVAYIAQLDRAKVFGKPIGTKVGNHSFRAIGITDYLERGGDINIAKRMAGHSNVKTTELYDRRGDEVSFSEIERVGI